ncbi:hypothetical protein BCR42DRAFT_413201 [Absidia repens]|uniref:Uncharacterized protein n=1 Tax=Absidia repens TaxID=90262 RepID=A0A1X2IKQ3_9FUNG|nr:hypothetical protein BCR42DRAFT_413201 [Absidia repens]
MNDINYTTNPLMYYVHPINETNNNNNNTTSTPMTQPHNMYYSPSLPGSSAMPIIPSPSEMDPTPHTMQQQPLPLSIMSNPLLPNTTPTTTPTTTATTATAQGQVYEHHPQELSPHVYSVPSSVIDEDVSSRNSASVSGHNSSGGQEAYIQQLQNQVEESKHLQTQYYYRIEQLMALVEKQTARINELQEQVSHSTMHDHGGGDNLQQQQQQQQQQQYSLQHTPPLQHHH